LALRLSLVLVGALLTVWFALIWHNERIGRAASDRLLSQPQMSAAEFAGALEDLENAKLLNPGEEWDTLRAAGLILRDKRAAVRLANAVVRREPDNLNAWVVVFNASRGRDSRRSAQAIAEIRRLSPALPSR